MKYLMEIPASPFMQNLGWTLLHSLWQGLFCMAFIMVLLRCIPSRMSSLRYAVSSLGLFLLLLVSIGTCTYLNGSALREPSMYVGVYNRFHETIDGNQPAVILSIRQMAIIFVENNIGLMVIAWGIGAFFFSLRVCAGYWYINGIRNSSIPLDDEWQRRIQQMSAVLGVHKIVSVAESHLIQAPVVFGYLKPLILIPVGMFSGLTTEQAESIFIHELIHIRRGDFIVNIVQCLLEAVFFFNPFVWMLSSTIRREREHCCDDNVIMAQGNPIAYARALAKLEEARLKSPTLALSLAHDKNQLLNRIKRIMEKSADRYPGSEKFVPVILLLLGLMCASWLSIAPANRKVFEKMYRNVEPGAILGDTSKKEKKSRHYRRTVRPAEGGGSDHEMEVYESDIVADAMDGVPPVEPVAPPERFDINIPEVPDEVSNFERNINIPDFPEFPAIAFDFDHFRFDTLQPYGQRSEEWLEFSEEFQKNFQEKFGEFYEQHEEELKEIMEQAHEQIASDVKSELHSFEHRHLEVASAEMAQQARRLADHTKQLQKANEHQLRKMQLEVRAMEDHMKMYDEKLGKELAKDGYFEEGEEISNIHITDSEIEINGKKIKDAHYKKYRELLNELKPPAPLRLE